MAYVGSDYWSVEAGIPFATLDTPRAKPGDIWQMNASFGRTADSEHARWIPSHGHGSVDALGLAEFE